MKRKHDRARKRAEFELAGDSSSEFAANEEVQQPDVQGNSTQSKPTTIAVPDVEQDNETSTDLVQTESPPARQTNGDGNSVSEEDELLTAEEGLDQPDSCGDTNVNAETAQNDQIALDKCEEPVTDISVLDTEEVPGNVLDTEPNSHWSPSKWEPLAGTMVNPVLGAGAGDCHHFRSTFKTGSLLE
ncbi:unnamed protein product [Echinostoma caproni]|uniref:Uncharacterized protein n=1 Tax=Echinostoma caproni TaxID=27848 RepID=A0A183AD93_9TREM|nr:unnamed protein product [Echinostoma caproni]